MDDRHRNTHGRIEMNLTIEEKQIKKNRKKFISTAHKQTLHKEQQ